MSATAPRWDVAVVGAGYGGATCAALLARAGRRVLLVDKNARAGGKAITVSRGGFRHELWPIAGGPAGPSRFHELVDLLGIGSSVHLLQPDAACEFLYLASDGSRRSMIVPARPVPGPLAVAKLVRRLGVPVSGLGGLAVLSALGALWPGDKRALDEVSALTLLSRLRLPAPLFSFLASLLNLLFVVPVDGLPASEALRTLADLNRGGAGRYHQGGFGAVAERAAAYVEQNGGRFLRRTRVRRILVRYGRAVGVETARGVYEARAVISSAGIQPTVLRLVGEEHFPAGWVDRVRGYEPSWALVGVRWELDQPVFRTPMTVAFSDESWMDRRRFAEAQAGRWPDLPLLFVTVPTLYDPSLSPGGRQLALLGTLGSPDPESPMNAEAIARVEAAARRLWPELGGRVVRRAVFSAKQVSTLSRDAVVPGQGGECIGLGQLIGQAGRHKPSARSPLPGLYFVGCDAGGYGCGTHQAVDSGIRVSAMVDADL